MMTFVPLNLRLAPLRRWAGLLCTLCLAGCQREGIRVYQVAKEQAAPAHAAESAQEAAAPAMPTLQYKLPAGWTEEPASQMRAASLSIAGPDGQHAEVAVIPLSGMGGNDVEFVNLWRKQLNLAPITDADLPNYLENVTIGGTAGKLFDVLGADDSGDAAGQGRTIVAVLARDGVSWFFKLAGHAQLIAREKPAFVEFLKSVSFHDAVASVAQREAEPDGKPQWDVPNGWQEQPPTQMLLAKFVLPGESGGKAEVTVSAFPGDVGGLLANVNRWRGQVGLTPLNETELTNAAAPLELNGAKATLVDIRGTDAKTGQPARLIGAIVPRGGQTWFYKLLGQEQVAEREKAAFLKFLQSVRYSNG